MPMGEPIHNVLLRGLLGKARRAYCGLQPFTHRSKATTQTGRPEGAKPCSRRKQHALPIPSAD